MTDPQEGDTRVMVGGMAGALSTVLVVCGAIWLLISYGQHNSELREKCVKRCLPAAADMRDSRCYCDDRWKAPES